MLKIIRFEPTLVACAACILFAATPPLSWGTAVPLQNSTALFHQTNFGNKDQTIDGNLTGGSNGIAFFEGRFGIDVLAWETQTDVIGPGLFTIQISSLLGSQHQVTQFRLAATDADRSLFADNNPVNGNNATQGDVVPSPGAFTLLSPVSATSSGGATMTVTPDGYITVSGTIPNTDVYTITAFNPLATTTGFRLELLPAGPGNSIGFAGNGNATITEFAVDFVAGGQSVRGLKQQVLQNATATFNQAGFTPSEAIDGVVLEPTNNGWAVFGGFNTPQSAVFQTSAPLDAEDLVVQLDFASQFGQHKMQRIRLSYTTDANPTATDGSIDWIELDPAFLDTSRSTSFIALLPGNIIEITDPSSPGQPDYYSLFFDNVNAQNITGFRLEALLGANGAIGFSGNGGNGNIVLTEFAVYASAQVPEPATVTLALLGLTALGRRRRRTA
ncbi:MAG: PEP-CTERM sorting domain-containing protein [Phycisphaeraceae bacterium]